MNRHSKMRDESGMWMVVVLYRESLVAGSAKEGWDWQAMVI